jgi:hypothetical protein
MKEKGLVKIPRIFLAQPLLTTLAPTETLIDREVRVEYKREGH